MENSLQKTTNQLALRSAVNPSTKKLWENLLLLGTDFKSEAKMELMIIGKELMPNGIPDFLSVIKYPKISLLAEHEGLKPVLVTLSMLVRDFCSSMNVVRNMNEDQIIEAAAMLLDECGDFRIEDYFMMFQMAKRGELFEIRDRIDIQVITKILDVYWEKRIVVGRQKQDEDARMYESMGNQAKSIEMMNKQDAKLVELSDKFTAGFDGIRQVLSESLGSGTKKYSKEELREIEKRDSELIREKQREFDLKNQASKK